MLTPFVNGKADYKQSLRNLSLHVLCFFIVFTGVCSAGKDTKTNRGYNGKSTNKPYLYFMNFEGGESPFKFLSTNSNVSIGFQGISRDMSFSGEHSFKIDLNFQTGSYYFLQIPLELPATIGMRFSGKILVESENHNEAGLGVGYQVWPCLPNGEDGSRASDWFGATKGRWMQVEFDIGERGMEVGNRSISKQLWGVDISETGVITTHIGLYLRRAGKIAPGHDRITVYLDDLTITGEKISLKSYMTDSEERWRQAAQRAKRKIALWQRELLEIQKKRLDLGELKGHAASILEAFDQELNQIDEPLQGVIRDGFITLERFDIIDPRLSMASSVLDNIRYIAENEGQEFFIYSLKPFFPIWTLPHDKVIFGKLNTGISISACPDEYEPASFVIATLGRDRLVSLTSTDLRSDNSIIAKTNVDIRVVKCWYQAGTSGKSHRQDKNKKVLTPELLLKNDLLVEVDPLSMQNYLNLESPAGRNRINISSPLTPKERQVIHPISSFPVKDSLCLQPVLLRKETNKQFWITIKVPDNAVPGDYFGKIEIVTHNGEKRKVELGLTVLPLRLKKPNIVSSMYYEGVLDPKGVGSISSILKNEVQFKAEMQNLSSHGVNNPIVALPNISGNPEQIYEETLLNKTLRLRSEAGLNEQDIYYTRFFHRALGIRQPKVVDKIDLNSSIKSSLSASVKRLISTSRSYGLRDVFIFGLDEANGNRLRIQEEPWRIIKESGAHIIASGTAEQLNYLNGEILDISVCSGSPHPKIAQKQHAQGKKVWCYANPQGGIENSSLYRRNYGVCLWESNYDGAAPWAYQASLGSIWNDFDSPGGRDYNFTYPTVDGVIDTLQWEGYREAMDDIRYLYSLECLINMAKEDRDRHLQENAVKAEKFLSELKGQIIDLDELRSKIAFYGKALSNGKPINVVMR